MLLKILEVANKVDWRDFLAVFSIMVNEYDLTSFIKIIFESKSLFKSSHI